MTIETEFCSTGCQYVQQDGGGSLTAMMTYLVLFFSGFMRIVSETSKVILAQRRYLIALNFGSSTFKVSVVPVQHRRDNSAQC